MQRPRITIAELILVVIVAALRLAALRTASAPWEGRGSRGRDSGLLERPSAVGRVVPCSRA